MSPPYFFVGFHFGRFASSKGDGSVKSPISALCDILCPSRRGGITAAHEKYASFLRTCMP